MNLPKSEKYFLECFDKIINTEECIIADPEEIRTYGSLFRLEGEIGILEKFFSLNPSIDVRKTLEEKRKQLHEIFNT